MNETEEGIMGAGRKGLLFEPEKVCNGCMAAFRALTSQSDGEPSSNEVRVSRVLQSSLSGLLKS